MPSWQIFPNPRGHLADELLTSFLRRSGSPSVSRPGERWNLLPCADRIPGTLISARRGSAALDELRDLIEAGHITPAIYRSYPLAEVPAAVRYFVDEHARGKSRSPCELLPTCTMERREAPLDNRA
jgi:NADPH:quinone reductase-like Zn-dependent oxidoreductase